MEGFAYRGFHVERLSPHHASALSAVLADLEPWRGLGYAAAALCRYLTRDDPALARWVVLDTDDAAAGLLCLRNPWLRGPFLEVLCVLPAWQGRGLGGGLLTHLASCVGQEGQGNLWTSASHNNAHALRFYQQQGFEPAGLLPDLIRPGVDEVLLRRRLTRAP